MELKCIIEAILFSAQKALTPKEIREVLKEAIEHDESAVAAEYKKLPVDRIISALEELAREHEEARRTFRLVSVAGSWQFVSQPEYAPWLKALVGHKSRPPRLSQPALETLAIIAYRQPLTRVEMEQVRGVAVDGVMSTLVDRGLVEQVGRADAPGRPMRYGTTSLFLDYFGLRSLEELPAADELRRIPIVKPDLLMTVDSGLATSPEAVAEASEEAAEIEAEPEKASWPHPTQ
jgi:segregation and condensation protein B